MVRKHGRWRDSDLYRYVASHWYNLYCVGGDVKHCSIHPLDTSWSWREGDWQREMTGHADLADNTITLFGISSFVQQLTQIDKDYYMQ